MPADTGVVHFRDSALGKVLHRYPRSPAALLATVILATAGWLFLVHVWPTRYRYDHLHVDGATYPVRIDRFTGTGEYFNGTWKTGEP